MRVPVVSSQQSWRRKRARTLRRIRETVQQSLHFFTLWGRTLQKIGGKYAFQKKKKTLLSEETVDSATFDDCLDRISFCVSCDWMVLLPNRELWRRRPVLLPLPAIPGAAQFSDLSADRCLRPGAQHHLPLIIIFSSSFNLNERPCQQLFECFWYWLPQSNTVFQRFIRWLLHCESFSARRA